MNVRSIVSPLFRACLIIAIAWMPQLATAAEQKAWPIITFTCDQEKGEVKLKNEVKWGDGGENFPFNEAQGTYNPWELVRIADRGARRLVSEKQQLRLSCKLGGVDYQFTVKPKIFNPNFNGKCGDYISVKVSIHMGTFVLLEEKPMQEFCHGNTQIIRGFKIKGGSNKVQVYKVSRSKFF